MSDDLHVGWSPDYDIAAAVETIPRARLSDSIALISMIDSTPMVSELPSLIPLLEEVGRSYTVVNDDVALDISTLMELIHEHDFLSGFDEVWLCSRMPSRGKPPGVRLTSDVPLQTEAPPGLTEWMQESGCWVGLGDGDGLNYATFDPELAELWKHLQDVD